MKTLAIEREFGSGGHEIGMKVAEMAGIPYYDTNLLVKAAEDFHIPIGQIEDLDEKQTGSFLYNLAMAANYTQGSSEPQVYKVQYSIQKTILKLQEKEPSVFIGRCATEILKDKPNVLKIYVYSSDEKDKIQRIMRTEQVSEAEAKKLMEKKDKNRRNYYNFWTGKNWSDRSNYDMELNTGKMSVEDCADLLLHAIRR